MLLNKSRLIYINITDSIRNDISTLMYCPNRKQNTHKTANKAIIQWKLFTQININLGIINTKYLLSY